MFTKNQYVLRKVTAPANLGYVGNVQGYELSLCPKEKAIAKCCFLERSQAIREATRLAERLRVSIAVEEV